MADFAEERGVGGGKRESAPKVNTNPLEIAAIGSDQVTSFLARKQQERSDGIARLIAEAKERGQPVERAFWAMVYDFEVAPMTTNAKQLAEVGLTLPAEVELSDDALHAKLWEVIRAMALFGVYFLHTDHLSDRELYRRLATEVLVEEVRDIVGVDNATEWVDLCTPETDEEWEQYEKYYSDERPGPEGTAGRDRLLPRPPSDPRT